MSYLLLKGSYSDKIRALSTEGSLPKSGGGARREVVN